MNDFCKRALALCLSAQLALPVLPQYALAQDTQELTAQNIAGVMKNTAGGQCGASLTWQLGGDGTLAISGSGDMYAYGQDTPWRAYADSIRAVVVEQGVASLSDYCFYGCSSLTSAVIQSGVTRLSDWCFGDCTSLVSVSIPESVTSLGDYCFYGCEMLPGLTVPASVISFGGSCFQNCTSLKAITIPAGAASLGAACFSGCISLTGISIPNGVSALSDWCFSGCTNLAEIAVPSSVSAIGTGCFGDCTSLKGITLSKGLVSLGDWCFSGCTGLVSVSIPDGIAKLGDYCFADCRSLSGVKIPASIVSLGQYCFYKCGSLSTVEIPAGMTVLPEGCFYGSGLTNIAVPKAVAQVGEECFAYCPRLDLVRFEGDAPRIGARAFVTDNATIAHDPQTSGWDAAQAQNYGGSLRWDENLLDTPELVSVTNTSKGVKVVWKPVKGAAQYRVFYKTDSGWKTVGNTADVSMEVTGLTSGESYRFTVRCTSPDGKTYTSAFDKNGMTIQYIAMPRITMIENVKEGIAVHWNAVKGASGYRVYYKTQDAKEWKGYGSTDKTTLTVTGLKENTKYAFTVRGIGADGKTPVSAYDGAGKLTIYVKGELNTPELLSVSNAVNGVTVKWGGVPGAVNYRVYYKESSDGKWVIAGHTSDTEYTVTGLKSGMNYSFTVRCATYDGETLMSSYDKTGLSIFYLAAPQISSVQSGSGGITIIWKAVPGAVNYRVYLKTATESWKNIGTTNGTSLTVKDLKPGETYTFTARCVSADGKTVISAYDTKGKSIKY